MNIRTVYMTQSDVMFIVGAAIFSVMNDYTMLYKIPVNVVSTHSHVCSQYCCTETTSQEL